MGLEKIRSLKPYQITIIVVGILGIIVSIAYILTKLFGEDTVIIVTTIGGLVALVAIVYTFATMISTANDDDDDDDDGKTYY